MQRAADAVPGSCNQAAPPRPFEARRPCFSRLGVHLCAILQILRALADTCVGRVMSMMGKMPHADWLSGISPVFITLLVQAALAFQKYRLNNGLMLATTLAAVELV